MSRMCLDDGTKSPSRLQKHRSKGTYQGVAKGASWAATRTIDATGPLWATLWGGAA